MPGPYGHLRLRGANVRFKSLTYVFNRCRILAYGSDPFQLFAEVPAASDGR
jgi:hypothetical protein